MRRGGVYGLTGGAVGAAGASTLGAATYFARELVTPQAPVDDVLVTVVEDGAITLRRDVQTAAPGRYSLFWDGGRGHLRMGEVLESTDELVTRRVDGVDEGTARIGPARMSGYYFTWRGAGLDHRLEAVQVAGPLGSMPAWQLRSPGSTRWAVLVHGRGAQRAECLRGVAPLHRAGLNVLIPAYRNDADAPAGPDRRYHLGLTEWEDLEAAMLYAAEQGATELVPVGWSMGGAVILQALDRSWLSDLVTRVVLNAPVLDWGRVVAYQGRQRRIPPPVLALGRAIVSAPGAHRMVGLDQAVPFGPIDWVARAGELRVPILLIHSVDDQAVPVTGSQELAGRRPDLVRLPPWGTARHCREWNVDPSRWEAEVEEFCAPAQPPPPSASVG